MASKIVVIAASFDGRSGAKPPSSPTAVFKPLACSTFFRSEERRVFRSSITRLIDCLQNRGDRRLVRRQIWSEAAFISDCGVQALGVQYLFQIGRASCLPIFDNPPYRLPPKSW